LQGNHRSWADFFVDAYLTEGRGQMMSRWATAMQHNRGTIQAALGLLTCLHEQVQTVSCYLGSLAACW